MNEKVYILLPVHNRCEVTRRFIASLKEQTYRHYHLVLIDDGSTDGTAEMVRAEMPVLSVITGAGNWWWAGALQQGYEWLRAQSAETSDLVLIINDDTEFTPDFLACAVGLMKNLRGTLLLAQAYSMATGQIIGGGVHVDWSRLQFSQTVTQAETNCLSTRGLFLSVGDFLRTGGFFPKILPHYLSDYEFTLRAHRKGLNLRVDESLSLRVDERATGFRQDDGGPFSEFLRRYFSRKSAANPFAWTAFIVMACPWQWKLLNLLRIWYGTGKIIAGRLFPATRMPPWS